QSREGFIRFGAGLDVALQIRQADDLGLEIVVLPELWHFDVFRPVLAEAIDRQQYHVGVPLLDPPPNHSDSAHCLISSLGIATRRLDVIHLSAENGREHSCQELRDWP